MKILIIDDQIPFAEGLKYLLETEKNVQKKKIDIVKNVDNGYVYIQDHGIPDLVLLDLNSDGGRGFRFFDLIHTMHVQVPVLIISANNSPTIATIAAEKGAWGFISKNSDIKEMLDAIETILSGKSYLPKPLQDKIEICERVTTRQQQVLYLLSQGLLNKQIASELNISANTVKAHLHDLFKHLKVTNRTAAVKNAQKYGLI